MNRAAVADHHSRIDRAVRRPDSKFIVAKRDGLQRLAAGGGGTSWTSRRRRPRELVRSHPNEHDGLVLVDRHAARALEDHAIERLPESERLTRQGLAPRTVWKTDARLQRVTTSASGSIIAGLLQMKFGLPIVVSTVRAVYRMGILKRPHIGLP